MGRMLDALQRVGKEQGESEPPASAPTPRRPTSDAGPMLVETEEIPFIEVGPRKSMIASPSVLACSPSHHLNAKSESVEPRIENPQPAAAVARTVQFRALPGRNGSHSVIAPELVAYHAPSQPGARAYGEVLEAVLRARPSHSQNAILFFTSSLPRCGTTTTVLNLAVTAANQEHRVLVVDANLRSPAVSERLGLANAPGFREVLAGCNTLDEVIQPTAQQNLFALTAGVRDGSGIRFVAGTLRSLLRQLRQRYPLIFVDGPCWDGRPDGTILASTCDAAFLVVPEQEADTQRTDALLQSLPSQGICLAGCILMAGTLPVR